MSDNSHLSTFLSATLLTSVVYGIAITLFVKSVGTMHRKRRLTGQLNPILVISSTLLFLLATVNVVGLWMNVNYAFVLYPGGPTEFAGLIRTTPKTVLQVGQVGAIILADALVVYRTYVVWGLNLYVIIIPFMTFVATFTCGVSFVRLQHTTSLTTSVFSTGITEWTVAFLLSSFATTVYSTGFISYKLWKSDKQLREADVSVGAGLSLRIMRIVMESAFIYSLNHLLYAIMYEAKTNVEAIPSFFEASVASITCSLIVIRCEKASKHPRTFSTSAGNDVVWSPPAERKDAPDGRGRLVFAVPSLGATVQSTSTDSERYDRSEV